MHLSLSAVAALLAAAPAAHAAGIYPKSSAVLQVEAKTYDKLIAKSNHTSIVEFYAPWCGHCQNLKPAYEKAAQNLAGLATVAAVNCDDEVNKPLCGSMGIQGFPTLKIVRPGKKSGRPVVEDYKGERSAAGIVGAVTASINNHVTRVTDKDLSGFLGDGEKPRALLFSEKGTTGTVLKSLAIDFLGQVVVGQVRSKEKATVERFGIDKFPTLVLVPAGGADPVVYSGEMKKEAMAEFLATVATPNADAARWAKGAGKKAKTDKKEKKEKKAEKKAEKKEEKEEEEEKKTEKKEKEEEKKEPLPLLASPQDAHSACFHSKAPTCVLILSSASATPDSVAAASDAVSGALDASWKWAAYNVGSSTASSLAQLLGTDADAEVTLAVVNSKRHWFAKYQGPLAAKNVRDFVQAVRADAWKRESLKDVAVEELSAGHDEL